MNEQLFLAYRNNGQPPLSLLYPSPILLMSRVGDGWTPCFLSLLLFAVGRGIVGPSPIKIMARGPIRAGRASPVPLYASLLGPLG
jgi:hypothetical protein